MKAFQTGATGASTTGTATATGSAAAKDNSDANGTGNTTPSVRASSDSGAAGH